MAGGWGLGDRLDSLGVMSRGWMELREILGGAMLDTSRRPGTPPSGVLIVLIPVSHSQGHFPAGPTTPHPSAVRPPPEAARSLWLFLQVWAISGEADSACLGRGWRGPGRVQCQEETERTGDKGGGMGGRPSSVPSQYPLSAGKFWRLGCPLNPRKTSQATHGPLERMGVGENQPSHSGYLGVPPVVLRGL